MPLPSALRSDGMTASLLQQGQEILWKWDTTYKGLFAVQSAYSFLIHSGELIHTGIWDTKMPERVKIFAWLMGQNRLLTQDNLIKRRWPHTQHCVMCRETVVESSEHLFLQ
jgi:zinc-binding in reverse transcriptase